jgi:tetratricopeptide (TPR) repeat protein
MTVPVRSIYWLMLSLGGVQAATAQQPDSLRWMTTFERSTSDGPRMYVSLGDQKEIVALFSLLVVRGTGVMGVEDKAGEIAVTVEQDGRVLPTSVDLRFLKRPAGSILTGDDYIEIRFGFRRTDEAAFSSGRYTFKIDVKPFLASLRLPDGSPWRGSARQDETKQVTIKSAATTEELAELHRVQGTEHLSSEQLELAVQHLEEAVKLQPEHWSTQYGLGLAYTKQHRYERAVEAFRRALPGWRRFPERRDDLPSHLAIALLALGLDSEAIAALEAAGVPAETIPERIKRLRATLNKR